MQLETYLRKLARDTYWQMLYQSAKEIKVDLFENKKGLSGIQLLFRHYLTLYSQLYENLGLDEFLSEQVIKDDLRCDAYLYLKRVERKQKRNEVRRQRIKDSLKGNHKNVSETTFYRKS